MLELREGQAHVESVQPEGSMLFVVPNAAVHHVPGLSANWGPAGFSVLITPSGQVVLTLGAPTATERERPRVRP
jgi:hypothetical protein